MCVEVGLGMISGLGTIVSMCERMEKLLNFLKMAPQLIYLTQSLTLHLRHIKAGIKMPVFFGRDALLNLLLVIHLLIHSFVLSFSKPY